MELRCPLRVSSLAYPYLNNKTLFKKADHSGETVFFNLIRYLGYTHHQGLKDQNKNYKYETINRKKCSYPAFKISGSTLKHQLRASSFELGNRAGSLTGTIFVVCSYGKFQPDDRDEIQETEPKWHHINLYCSRLS